MTANEQTRRSDMNDGYKSIEEKNPGKKWKVLVVFDDMIADMISNKSSSSSHWVSYLLDVGN